MYEYFFNYYIVFGNEVIGNVLQCNEVLSKEVKKVGRLFNLYIFIYFGKIKKKNLMFLYMYILNFKGIFVENI